MKAPKTITPLFWRVMVFLVLFIVISGMAGPRIISGGILFRDGFALYGSIGKAMIFGAIAFVLLLKHSHKKEITLAPWTQTQLVWLAASILSFVASWAAVSKLLADERSSQILATAHLGLCMSVVFALLCSFGIKNIRLLWQSYKQILLQSGIIAVGFYAFLLGVYALWGPLASIVMHSVNALLQLSGLETGVVLPHTLVLDKFGITVAEYCSGIESIALFTGLYVIVGLLDWKKINRRRYLAVFPIALLLLCAFNILRVSLLILAGYHINPEIAFSLFHSYAGMVFFIIYSALFWSVAYKYIMSKSTQGTPPQPLPPANVIISHVYSSDNKGDAALTSVLIDDIKRVFPKAKITILKLGPVQHNAKFEGVLEKPGFMNYALNKYSNPLMKLLYTTYLLLATLIWAIVFRVTKLRLYLPSELKGVIDTYVQSDLIVAVGGGYIRSRKGIMQAWNIPLILHPLLLSHILGKRTVLYSQSVGPFVHALEPVMVAFVLKKMSLILLREDTSKKLLADLDVKKNVVRAVDSGFLLKSAGNVPIRKLYNIPAKKLVVGVTVRAWLPGNSQTRYEQAVAEALDAVIDKHNAYVLFIPQVTADKGDDDRIVSRRVHDYMQHTSSAYVIEDEPDHHRIKSIYDKLDVLLGTRFHSVIFSLTSFVPVVAIEYEHKTSGIMHDLGLDAWAIKIEDVTAPRLSSMLSKLIAEKTTYKKQLKKCVPPYVEKARETATMMADAYYKVKR